MNTLVSSVRRSEMWTHGRGTWFAVVFSLALGCGKSVRESSEGNDSRAGEAGEDGGGRPCWPGHPRYSLVTVTRKKTSITRPEPGYHAVLSEVVGLIEAARRAS
ncbi:MAG TPA: hypothetical protein VF989_19575, partial [Polyangiaceae bacterium]